MNLFAKELNFENIKEIKKMYKKINKKINEITSLLKREKRKKNIRDYRNNLEILNQNLEKMEKIGLFKFKLKIGFNNINEIFLSYRKNKYNNILGGVVTKESSFLGNEKKSYNDSLKQQDREIDEEVSNLINNIINNDGTYLISCCRGAVYSESIPKEEIGIIESVARVISRPSDGLPEDETDFEYHREMCCESDCRENFKVKCVFCDYNLCPKHVDIFYKYLKTGICDEEDEENHYYNCLRLCSENYCQSQAVFPENNTFDESLSTEEKMKNCKMFCLKHFISNKLSYLQINDLLIDKVKEKIKEKESYKRYLNKFFNFKIIITNNILVKLSTLLKNIIEAYKLSLILYNNKIIDNYYLLRLDLLIARCVSITQELSAKKLELNDESKFLEFCITNEELSRKISIVDTKYKIITMVLTKEYLRT